MLDQNARQNTFGVVRVRVLDDALELASLNRLRHHIRLKDKSELSRYERTARQPSLRTALACQEVFGTPVPELFSGLNDSVVRDTRGQMVKLRMRLQRKVGECPDQCDAGKVRLH
jgi:transcriptional regulator with XRE-family HTH domain